MGFVHNVFKGPWWFSSNFIMELEDTKMKSKSIERRSI